MMRVISYPTMGKDIFEPIPKDVIESFENEPGPSTAEVEVALFVVLALVEHELGGGHDVEERDEDDLVHVRVRPTPSVPLICFIFLNQFWEKYLSRGLFCIVDRVTVLVEVRLLLFSAPPAVELGVPPVAEHHHHGQADQDQGEDGQRHRPSEGSVQLGDTH